jgi:hypothetical protein
MINMKALPPSWAALLSRVKIRLDCSAVTAGGAIRDLLLAEEPVKDLDIFVLGPSVRDLGKLTSACGEPPYTPYFIDDGEPIGAVFLEPMRVRDSLEQRLVCAAAIEPTPMIHEALSRTADLGISALCSLHCAINGARACIDCSTRSGIAFRQYWKSQGAIRGSADR